MFYVCQGKAVSPTRHNPPSTPPPRFDNSYFTTMYDPNADPELLKLDTDLCIFGDEAFRPFAMKVRR